MPPISLQNLPKYRLEALPLPPFPRPIPPACILHLPYRTNYSKPETQSACDNPGVTVGGVHPAYHDHMTNVLWAMHV